MRLGKTLFMFANDEMVPQRRGWGTSGEIIREMNSKSLFPHILPPKTHINFNIKLKDSQKVQKGKNSATPPGLEPGLP